MGHTKGNWYVSGETKPDGSIIIRSDVSEFNKKLVAYVSDNDTDIREEPHANAKLISAAPELLEALKAIKEIGEFKADGQIGKIINNAINKATI